MVKETAKEVGEFLNQSAESLIGLSFNYARGIPNEKI